MTTSDLFFGVAAVALAISVIQSVFDHSRASQRRIHSTGAAAAFPMRSRHPLEYRAPSSPRQVPRVRTFRLSTTATLATAVLLMPACTTEVDGAPLAAEQATSATPSDTAGIASVLPTASELSGILGDQIDEVDPLIGDTSDLRDTMAGSEVTESRCIGVISPLERHTYDRMQVREVAYATLPQATFGALAMPSAEAARALFDTFVDAWSSCDGKTVVTSDGVDFYHSAISDIETTNDVMSALIVISSETTGKQVHTQRALGVAENYLVDVEINLARSSSDEPAVTLTELMMAKVPAARR